MTKMCYKCKKRKATAYFKAKPICQECWRSRFPSNNSQRLSWLNKFIKR